MSHLAHNAAHSAHVAPIGLLGLVLTYLGRSALTDHTSGFFQVFLVACYATLQSTLRLVRPSVSQLVSCLVSHTLIIFTLSVFWAVYVLFLLSKCMVSLFCHWTIQPARDFGSHVWCIRPCLRLGSVPYASEKVNLYNFYCFLHARRWAPRRKKRPLAGMSCIGNTIATARTKEVGLFSFPVGSLQS